MNYPKISIVTPSLNQGQFIRQTIDSILVQEYPNLEYTIVDGGSTDNTLDILKSYGDRIKWISERDQGQADAINKGLGLSTGEILAYINSDDCYLPGTFAAICQEFCRGGCRWLTGNYRIVDQNSHEIQRFTVAYKTFWRKFSSQTMLSLLNYIIQPSTFWSRELWNQVGPFDIRLHYALDYDFWMRAMQIERPLILNQTLSMFRIHQSSKGGVHFEKQFNEENMVLERYTHNPLVIGFHEFHNVLVKWIYKFIK